jgi:hypothetical protein
LTDKELAQQHESFPFHPTLLSFCRKKLLLQVVFEQKLNWQELLALNEYVQIAAFNSESPDTERYRRLDVHCVQHATR